MAVDPWGYLFIEHEELEYGSQNEGKEFVIEMSCNVENHGTSDVAIRWLLKSPSDCSQLTL